MKEQIETLIKLQGIETEASRVRILIDQLDRKAEGLEEELKAAEAVIDRESASLEELKKAYRSQESDTKMNSETIRKNQERLSIVKTNKEYQALLKGIDEINRKNNRIEDEMIALLERVEAGETNVEELEAAYERLKIRIQSQKESIRAESEQSREKLLRLGEERDRVAAEVSADLIRKYEIVKKQDSGPAVVGVKRTVCQGCNMNIPPQMANELRRFEDLKFCPFCNRIIYWEKSE